MIENRKVKLGCILGDQVAAKETNERGDSPGLRVNEDGRCRGAKLIFARSRICNEKEERMGSIASGGFESTSSRAYVTIEYYIKEKSPRIAFITIILIFHRNDTDSRF